MSWRYKAACSSSDPELFFPIGSSATAVAQAERAKHVCNNCSVAQNCLSWAVKTNQEAGIWGGLSEDERRGIRHNPIKLV